MMLLGRVMKSRRFPDAIDILKDSWWSILSIIFSLIFLTTGILGATSQIPYSVTTFIAGTVSALFVGLAAARTEWFRRVIRRLTASMRNSNAWWVISTILLCMATVALI